MEEYEVFVYLFNTVDYALLKRYKLSDELAELMQTDYRNSSEIWELSYDNEEVDTLLLAAADQAAKYVHEYYIASDEALRKKMGLTQAYIDNMWDYLNMEGEEKAEFLQDSAEDQISNLASVLYDNQAFTIFVK